MGSLLSIIEKQSNILIFLFCVILVIFIGILDYITGYFISFSLFYLIPVALVSWKIGKREGLFIAAIAAFSWYLAEISTGKIYPSSWIAVWNSMVRLGIFLLFVLLLAALRSALMRERNFARRDHLTGVENSRSFFELAEIEIQRAERYNHPFTLAYVDLDNFKTVNDLMGHHTGDELLIKVAEVMKSNVRATDIIARMGGDEFAILFPETDAKAAEDLLSRMRRMLLEAMHANQWPVTLSVGVITYLHPPGSLDEVVREADRLMYLAKETGKDRIRYFVAEKKLSIK